MQIDGYRTNETMDLYSIYDFYTYVFCKTLTDVDCRLRVLVFYVHKMWSREFKFQSFEKLTRLMDTEQKPMDLYSISDFYKYQFSRIFNDADRRPRVQLFYVHKIWSREIKIQSFKSQRDLMDIEQRPMDLYMICDFYMYQFSKILTDANRRSREQLFYVPKKWFSRNWCSKFWNPLQIDGYRTNETMDLDSIYDFYTYPFCKTLTDVDCRPRVQVFYVHKMLSREFKFQSFEGECNLMDIEQLNCGSWLDSWFLYVSI